MFNNGGRGGAIGDGSGGIGRVGNERIGEGESCRFVFGPGFMCVGLGFSGIVVLGKGAEVGLCERPKFVLSGSTRDGVEEVAVGDGDV